MDPFNPSVNQFGKFLISIHDKNFSPSTVKGYRLAISTTLKLISKVDFANELVLSDLFCSFELERPRTKKGKRKVQGVPQSQTAALSRPQEEEETNKSKQAQIKQTYEKH